MIVCAGDSEQFEFAAPIGVGLVNAALNLSKLIIETDPEFILFVGTAGSYGKKKILDLVKSKTASNIEHSLLLDTAYTPLDNIISSSDIVSRETIVNSSNYITQDEEISKKYIARGIDLENMEFFSVMSAGKRFNIPAGGVFVVTNFCGRNAHREFMENQKKAMQILEDYLKKSRLI